MSVAELARVVESIYRAAFFTGVEECYIVPKEYEALRGLYWFFYNLLTFWLPQMMMIKLMWISKEQYSYRNNDVSYIIIPV